MEFASENDNFKVDNAANSNTLLLVFGGIALGFGMPVFEFNRILKKYDVNKLFIRDLRQGWYNRGFVNVSSNFHESAAYLKTYISENFPNHTLVTMGNSSGGFAAIAFGHLLGAKEIHAFAPQSFVDPINKIKHFDKRWLKQLAKVYTQSGSKVLDLKPFLNTQDIIKNTHIYYCSKHRLDNLHAERLKAFDFNFHAYPKGGHQLIKELKNQGELDQILQGIVNKY